MYGNVCVLSTDLVCLLEHDGIFEDAESLKHEGHSSKDPLSVKVSNREWMMSSVHRIARSSNIFCQFRKYSLVTSFILKIVNI